MMLMRAWPSLVSTMLEYVLMVANGDGIGASLIAIHLFLVAVSL